jgi:hypothetical protein
MAEAGNSREQIIDAEHLRLLTIGHYVAGGLHIAFASLFIFHFVFALAAATNPDFFGANQQAQNGPPSGFFNIFAWVIGFFILAGWTFGGLTIFSGRCIKSRIHHTLSLVVAAFNALVIPVGTALCVCSMIVLSRPSVKNLPVYAPTSASLI